MKAMISLRGHDTEFTPQSPVVVLPDSAVLRNGRPWFIPPFATDWTFQTVLLLRVSRLGHCIGKKFATRYFDAVSLGVMPRPEPFDPANGLLNAFDGALIAGEWLPLPDDGRIVAETTGGTVDLSEALLAAPDIIALYSSYASFKMGDVVGVCTFAPMVNPPLDTRWEGSINGTPLLSFAIK